MDQNRILAPLRRWWWLLLAAAMLAGLTSFIIFQSLDPTFRATATLIVGRTISNPNPTSGEFYLGQQLASIYASIGLRDPVQNAVRAELGLTDLPDYSIRALPNSQLIEISVIDTNPDRAKVVANELGNQLIRQSPSQSTSNEGSAEFIQSQLTYLEDQIEKTLGDIAALQIEIAEMVSAADIESAQTQMTVLQDKLSILQTNYAALLANSQIGASNFIEFFDEAETPHTPIGPSRAIIVALAAALGIGIAAGGIYLLEYFDMSLRSPTKIEKITNSQILGAIPDSKALRSHYEQEKLPFVLLHPFSQITEAFHQIRAGMENSWGEKPPKSILITGLGTSSGKTTTAINLAASFILTGRNVLLVDLDFRKPELHSRLNLPENPGLSEAVIHNFSPERIIQSLEPRYKVITNGSEKLDPVVFLSSLKFRSILAKFEMESDLIILDGPPLFVTDALLISSKVDGVVILVEPGQVSEANAARIMSQLQRANPNILGVVLSKVHGDIWPNYRHGRNIYFVDPTETRIKSEEEESSQDRESEKVPPFKEPATDS